MVVVAAIVAIVVLARLSGTPAPASSTRSKVTTTTRVAPTTTTSSRARSTTTTLPPTTTTTLPPASVLVRVFNGWTTAHGALYFKNQLAKFGYDLGVPLDAATSNNTTSKVFYLRQQYRANALAIAAYLAISPAEVVVPTATNSSALTAADKASADVILLVGADISARVPANYTG